MPIRWTLDFSSSTSSAREDFSSLSFLFCCSFLAAHRYHGNVLTENTDFNCVDTIVTLTVTSMPHCYGVSIENSGKVAAFETNFKANIWCYIHHLDPSLSEHLSKFTNFYIMGIIHSEWVWHAHFGVCKQNLVSVSVSTKYHQNSLEM